MDSKKLIKALEDWNCDTKSALDRMLGDEDFYASLLMEYKDSFDFNRLREASAQGRCQEAFEVAHALKGVLGNLGLTPLYTMVCEVVEMLRKGSCEGIPEKADAMIAKKAELDRLLKEAIA